VSAICRLVIPIRSAGARSTKRLDERSEGHRWGALAVDGDLVHEGGAAVRPGFEPFADSRTEDPEVHRHLTLREEWVIE
jgi:hypothetical protein